MKSATRLCAAVFAAIPVAMLTAATLCTWLIAGGASMQWRLLFRHFCHGMPRRCFDLWDVPMPICARCTALYVGMLAGVALFCILPWVQERLLRLVLFVAATPLAVDGITQAMGLRESTNGLRAATGLAAGLAFGFWVLSAVEQPKTQGFPTS